MIFDMNCGIKIRRGTACITLGSGALFSGNWNGILNYLARRGLNYNQTLEHQEIGEFFATYDCNYNPSSSTGNSYLSIYGWTIEPLIEFYIIEDWRNWIPSMSSGSKFKGTINKNGSIYDIYENTRTNQPSIKGNATFQQYFSIRRGKRNSGTIDITEHFKHWESLGMNMGKMHEVSFVVEGYQSNGSFDFKALDVFVNNSALNIEEIKAEPTHVNVYSKPNSGTISIKFDEANLNISVNVYDISGKILFSKEKINNQLLQISNLKNGIYFVKINNNELNYRTKVIIY
jgi:endo-1,4-beta-xylanase